MFDPENHQAILRLTPDDVSRFPSAEDGFHEYKSGQTKDEKLSEKIALAASGFWNSGGGLFVCGVNGNGRPDGGVSLFVNRQSRRDWIDQSIARVTPRAPYVVHHVEKGSSDLDIPNGNAVFMIGFGPSHVGPHMAPDNKYYIRAGAHTVPASHFIVDALFARRGASSPVLSHVVSVQSGFVPFVHLTIVCLNHNPAIDVQITMKPMPFPVKTESLRWPIVVPVISKEFPHAITWPMVFGPQHPPQFGLEARTKLGFYEGS